MPDARARMSRRGNSGEKLFARREHGLQMSDCLWTPTAEQIAAARITAFQKLAADQWRVDLSDYARLHRWSIDAPEQFWDSIWKFCGVVASRPPEKIVVDFDRLPGA